MPPELHGRPGWRSLCVVGALLALAAAFTPNGASAQAPAPVPTVLARGAEDLSAGAMLVRVVDTTLPPGEPGVTHAHASGFDYAFEGTHVVTIDGEARAEPEGHASWVGPMAEHTHGSLDGAGMRFWFVAFRPATTRGAPPAWPYPTTRIRSESEDVPLPAAGPYELTLSEVHLEAPGAATGPLARSGPVAVTVVAGAVQFGAEPIPTDGIAVQYPGDGRRFTNRGPGSAHLLILAVAPAGRVPALLPRTGDPLPAVPAALAAGAAVLAGLGTVLRRRRGTPRVR